MGAVAERLEEGASVDLLISASGRTLRATARITRLAPYRSIVIRHETPWEGETRITFAARSNGTSLRAITTLPEEAVAWIGETLPAQPRTSQDEHQIAPSIALLTSLSGESGFVGRAAANCALLAVEELNALGGVDSVPLQLQVGDDQTSPSGAVQAMESLLARKPLAIIGMHTSLSLTAIEPLIAAHRVPYIYAAPHELDQRTGTLLRLGGSVHRQVKAAVPRLVDRIGPHGGCYLIGNDYSWPRSTLDVARQACVDAGMPIAGEEFVALDADIDFADVVERIRRSGATMVVSALIGFASIDFERAFSHARLRDRVTTFSALLDEPTLALLGADGDGIWSCVTYYRDLDTPSNGPFLSRYFTRFGAHSPMPSALSAPVYEAVLFAGRAAHRVADGLDTDVSTALSKIDVDGPRGPIPFTGDRFEPPVYLVRATRGGLQLAEVLSPVE